eukprot:TRINITY_DN13967_c0_g1_i1.p1 TRINITY_DN13967_c0_g1~~TRINITY_DN13967_c0_g1_i1.p1  ORF type:complete len:289 (+),score=85.85 TRINITY_DN13967_c0_g1_i1:390-1256(+)
MKNMVSLALRKKEEKSKGRDRNNPMYSTRTFFPERNNSFNYTKTCPDLHSEDSQIGKAEKAEVKSFIEKAWKELMLLEKDKRHQKLKTTKPMQLKSLKGKDLSLTNLHSGFQIATSRSFRAKNTPLATQREPLTSKNNTSRFFLTQPDLYDLERQTQNRIKGRKEKLKKLKFEEEEMQKTREKQQQEWEALKSKVDKFEDRFNMALETVEMHKFNKKIIAAQSMGNIFRVQENAKEIMEKKLKEKEENYIAKAYKVEESKKKKEHEICLLYTSPSPRDLSTSRMPSSA